MALESVNNMHVITIQEKDALIKDLKDQLAMGGGPGAHQRAIE